MKKYLVTAALSVLTILNTSAQDDAKVRRDVTYSSHNYKQPNKVAVARQWETKKGVLVNTPTPSKGPAVSYKNQVPGRKPVGGVVMTHTPVLDVAVRNYKIQRVFVTATPPN